MSTGDKAKSWVDYEAQMSLVTAYIYEHLDEEIDLFAIADVACMSPYHWHRVYHALRGETIAATVRRLRLHRAAGFLAQTDIPVEEIAKRSGYGSVQAFTRAFSAVYEIPPAQYRAGGSHTQFQTGSTDTTSASYELSIKEVPELHAVSVAHTGSYMEVGKAFDALYGWLGSRDLITPEMRSIGVFYDDPSAISEEELRSRACVVPAAPVMVQAPIEETVIAAGSYAVLRHKGPYATMRAAYQWLFGPWLLQSGRELADQPVFEEYLNSPQDTKPNDLLTDIYLPLK